MTEKVEVAFGLAFIQLINVNEKNQIMKSNVWLRLVWNDYQLQWDEADYGGISVLRQGLLYLLWMNQFPKDVHWPMLKVVITQNYS